MLIKSNNIFSIEDFYKDKDEITIFTNIKPDFNILRDSKTLNIDPMVKTAKVIKIAPKENDFLYIRNRAVSAGNVIEKDAMFADVIDIEQYYKNFDKYAFMCRNANQNGDFFSHEELIQKYKTFIGKSVFVDHDNDNVEKSRGIIIDAVYNTNGKYVELLKAIDKKAYPELAQGIIQGYITDTSMGCKCEYSLCSICGNKAHSDDEFCEHIIHYKGSQYNGYPVFEDNRNIEFFEDSIVTVGADPDAKILEKVAKKGHNTIKKTTRPNYDNIKNEKNQRTRSGRIDSFTNKLSEIDWS